MHSEEILRLIEKIANGYEYEEIQTVIEETQQGQKKKIIRIKKKQPANLQAAQYLLQINAPKISVKDMEKLIDESIKKMEDDEKWKL